MTAEGEGASKQAWQWGGMKRQRGRQPSARMVAASARFAPSHAPLPRSLAGSPAQPSPGASPPCLSGGVGLGRNSPVLVCFPSITRCAATTGGQGGLLLLASSPLPISASLPGPDLTRRTALFLPSFLPRSTGYTQRREGHCSSVRATTSRGTDRLVRHRGMYPTGGR